jgi:hypothetical protein
MKKTVCSLAVMLTAIFLLTAAFLAAQDMSAQSGERPRLAVVPFSGGEGNDGETIAELFSGSEDLAQVFRIYLRTSITFGIAEERNVQKYVVSNEEYRNQLLALGINYVVAGDITRLGKQNLLVISIIDIVKLVQIGGDVQIFENKQEIEGKLPGMARNIIDGAKVDWTNKPKLAVVNPSLGDDNADPVAANVLGEILGIEITRTGKYAVYPRNASLEAVQTEWDNQRRGTADPRGPGNADRPELVLNVIARGGEGSITASRFNASIMHLDTEEQIVFATQTYRTIEDGIQVMETIAKQLTGVAEMERLAEEAEAQRLREQEAATAAHAAAEAANEAKRATKAVKAARTLEGKETAAMAAAMAADKANDFSNKAAEAAPNSEAVTKAKVSAREAATAAQAARKEVDAAKARKEFFSNDAHLFSAGVSIGSSFTAPWLIGTVQGTFSALKHTFFDLGCDIGFIHGYKGWEDIAYHSFYPFAHFNGFVPIAEYGVWYAGLGCGYMMAFYSGNGENNASYVPALDAATGLYLGKNHHYLTLSYALRTKITFEFKAVNHKVTLGYSYRFR